MSSWLGAGRLPVTIQSTVQRSKSSGDCKGLSTHDAVPRSKKFSHV